MTRENKLALVVGFGLLLFVGILVSDHFSAAQRQETTKLSASDTGRDRAARPITIAAVTPPAASATTVQPEPMAAPAARAASGSNTRCSCSTDSIVVLVAGLVWASDMRATAGGPIQASAQPAWPPGHQACNSCHRMRR